MLSVMKTLQKQTSLFTEEILTSLRADSLVKETALQEIGLEQMMTVTSGRKCLESLTKHSPLPWLVKTLLESSVWKIGPGFTGMYSLKWKTVPLPDFTKLTTMKQYTHDKLKCSSTVSAKILKKEAMKSKRLLYRLQLSAHRTKEKGSGLLPTPQAIDGQGSGRELRLKTGNRNPEAEGSWRGDLKDYAFKGMLPTPQTQGLKVCEEGKSVPINLKLLPTPTASDTGGYQRSLTGKREIRYGLMGLAKNGLLPTPQARDHRGMHAESSKKFEARKAHSRGVNLVEYLQREMDGKTSQLNPQFVMEMMGFPPTHTLEPFETKMQWIEV